MPSFSDQLRAEAQPLWDRIYRHPFLLEARDRRLPLEKFRFFLLQDFLYLEAFARAVAIALGKAPDGESVEALGKRVLTPIERPLHRQLLEQLEVSPELLAGARHAPTCLAYTNHMLATAHQHGLGVTAAALLPCPWTYNDLDQVLGKIDHPILGPWADFYLQGMLKNSVAAWRGFVDHAAETAGPAEREAMRRVFLTSSRYELQFWDMAYTLEQWP